MSLTDAVYDVPVLPEVLASATKKDLPLFIYAVKSAKFQAWLVKQADFIKTQVAASGWKAQDSSVFAPIGPDGKIHAAYIGYDTLITPYTSSAAAEKLPKGLYKLESASLKKEELENFCLGWYLAAYKFDLFKKSSENTAVLVWPEGVDRKRVTAQAEALFLQKNLINLPANILGPSELAHVVENLAEKHEAIFRIIEDKDLLRHNLPLVYAVGDSSDRRPCFAELAWGNPKHPKVSLVGKGVCFDTGGNDIKPSANMLLMKKDMAGAAGVLAMAHMVMSLDLPVYLRVFIPCVENSVSGRAFRPGDILTSRLGKTVEIGNTDAEGRLILADALAMACEEEPDLLVDLASLTGAAHYAVGHEMAPVYSNDEKLAEETAKLSHMIHDPLWHLPLWKDYRADILSPNADLNNAAAGNPAGSITAALFLNEFVTEGTDWIHIDAYSWQNAPKPGKPRGGRDMGVRTIFALIEKKFGVKKTGSTPKKSASGRRRKT